jgi:hypothetical protein
MRMMNEFYGILLLDLAEIILRVYQTDGKQWNLLHYFSHDLATKKLESDINALDITDAIIDFLSRSTTQNITEWKICSRGFSEETISIVSEATGFKIERLERAREQELLCKGMFTELW